MTTITLDSPSTTGRLEELVDRLLAALFKADAARATPAHNLVKTVHEARRLRQSGDLDGSLAVLADVDTANATDGQLRWLYAEWLDIAQRRFAASGRCSTAPLPAGRRSWFSETAATGRWKWRRPWVCAGRWASWSPGAACGG